MAEGRVSSSWWGGSRPLQPQPRQQQRPTRKGSPERQREAFMPYVYILVGAGMAFESRTLAKGGFDPMAIVGKLRHPKAGELERQMTRLVSVEGDERYEALDRISDLVTEMALGELEG